MKSKEVETLFKKFIAENPEVQEKVEIVLFMTAIEGLMIDLKLTKVQGITACLNLVAEMTAAVANDSVFLQMCEYNINLLKAAMNGHRADWLKTKEQKQ